MIRRVLIEGFKRFERAEFVLPGHLVVAGPNNTGKTTLLQAIAAWSFALRRWKQLNAFQRRGGQYKRAPIARQAFAAVPLRAFDLLWRNRVYDGEVAITIATDAWTLKMRFLADSTEQIYVRPEAVSPEIVRRANMSAVFVPPMTGLSIDEPVYQRPKLDQLLGQGRPGEMLRNLLLEAHASDDVWARLQGSIRRLFGYTLLPPNAEGAHIIAEYTAPGSKARLDVASAGSGFQQVLMLIAMLQTRPDTVLLLDEPDAHLHLILQDAIYGELVAVAARTRAQLVVATHSEVIINSVDPRELCVLLDLPQIVADSEQRRTLLSSLRVISNEDIMLALKAPGVLYLEGHTDLELLRSFARVLNHPAEPLLTTEVFWKPIVAETRAGGPGIKAREHYDSLRLAKDLPGLELIDGDSRGDVPSSPLIGSGFQRIRWRRYEIESYLVHPQALSRFVRAMVGPANAAQHEDDLDRHLRATLPPAVYEQPLGDHTYLNNTKARTEILPPALSAAGLPALPYTRYHEIAATMTPDEVHPDVRQVLDGIVKAFGR